MVSADRRGPQLTCASCAAGGDAAASKAPGPASGTWTLPERSGQGATKGDWCEELEIEGSLRLIRWYSSLTCLTLVALVLGVVYLFPPNTLPQKCVAGTAALVGLVRRHLWMRYMQVAWVCTVIGLNCYNTRKFAEGRSKHAEDAAWEWCNRVNARFIFDTVVTLGGFWVKLAQGLSTTPIMPDAFGQELSRLQDCMPSDSREQVEATLAEALGRDWTTKVKLHPGPPLGSATIAQVHRATLTLLDEDGVERKVEGVVKVQHPNVEWRLNVDIRASSLLSTLITSFFPHLYSDLRSIVQELASITKAELDFRVEAENQMLAHQSLCKSGLNVTVPRIFPSLVTRKVIGMEFVDGTKISELTAVASGSERRRVIMDLIDYYGYTLHGPIFNFDPHPGNILIDRTTGRICMLDWGQARRLSVSERVSWGKIFVGADLEDFALFKRGVQELDHQGDLDAASDEAAVSLCCALRFLLKDSRPRADSRRDFQAVSSAFERLDHSEVDSFRSSSQEIFKGPFLAVGKASGLLNDVSGNLGVTVPLLHLIASHGYRLLLQEGGFGAVPLRQMPSNWVLDLPQQPPTPWQRQTSMQARLERLLRELHGDGGILGAQLAVLDGRTGACLANVALGHCSWTEPFPVQARTLFNILELSKLYLALAMLQLVDRGTLSLGDVVARPPSAGGKQGQPAEEVTLEQVLSHTAGMFKVLPEFLDTRSSLKDLEANMERMAEDPPLVQPGLRQVYHHSAYGWLLARACKQNAGMRLESVWSNFADAALGPGGRELLALTAAAGPLARPNKEVRTQTVEEFAKAMAEFDFYAEALAKTKDPKRSAEERADGICWRGMQERHPWTFLDESVQTSTLPGMQAFASAITAARALQSAAVGKVLRPTTIREALASRKPPGKPLCGRMGMDTRIFQGAEWGLGIQLDPLRQAGAGASPPAGRRAAQDRDALPWGGVATNGSFALVIPGRQPLVAAFLVNRQGSTAVAQKVQAALLREAAQRAP